ncbi:hypothetical protein M8J77_014371 [Diaphorina citri]|nr:hypothetical protein M8J77_014371 [Diaphorina citri]
MMIQDQVIKTKNYMKHILKLDIPDDKCRVCHQGSETIQHITSACSSLANSEYLYRHNLSAKIIHQFIGNTHGLITNKDPHYKYYPEPVLENESHKLYWDTTIITDRRLPANRPDIVLIDKIQKNVKSIDIAHSNDHNILITMGEKIRKYQDLGIEIKDMWNMDKVEIVPVVVSTNGLIHPSLYEHIKKIQLPHYVIQKVQKNVKFSNYIEDKIPYLHIEDLFACFLDAVLPKKLNICESSFCRLPNAITPKSWFVNVL